MGCRGAIFRLIATMFKRFLGSPTTSISTRYLKVHAKPKDQKATTGVTYGQDWYEATKNPSRNFRTVREELEYRRDANLAANNGKERKDLYTDNWDGSEWKGGSNNILTFIGALFVLVPVLGLVFAYFTYGDLWG